MYEPFYGFREPAFDLTPNPRFLFLTGKHREALSTIRYGLSSRKGITLIVGEAGTGKTTLIRAALDELRRPEHRFVHLSNPTLTRAEFYELLASSFGLSAEAAASKAQFLVEIERSVSERRAAGGLSALIIDEAQSLPAGLLEEVRLLANLETSDDKLLPLLLVGQPEIAERLDEEGWQQLKQRVALRCEIGRLDIRETAAYIAGRVRIAGGDVTQVFTRDAVGAIFQHSRGIPRVISVICDNALVTGFAAGARPITRQIVLEVCRDFRLAEEIAGTGAEAGHAPHHPHGGELPAAAGTATPAMATGHPAARSALVPPRAAHSAAGPADPSAGAASKHAIDELAARLAAAGGGGVAATGKRLASTIRDGAEGHVPPRLNVPAIRPSPQPSRSRHEAVADPSPAQLERATPAGAPAPAASGGDRESLFRSFQRKRRFKFF